MTKEARERFAQEWANLKFLKAMTGVRRAHPQVLERDFPWLRGMGDALNRAKKIFSPHVFQQSQLKLKELELVRQIWWEVFVENRYRVSVNFNKPGVVNYSRSSKYFAVGLAWRHRVYKKFYNGKTENMKKRQNLVLAAEAFRLPDRRFNFFRVSYFTKGEWKLKEGYAAQSREHPDATVVVNRVEDLVSKAELALAAHIRKELFE